MKSFRLFTIFLLLGLPLTSSFADEYVANPNASTETPSDDQGTNLQKLVKYLDNLGKYFGYDLTNDNDTHLTHAPENDLLTYTATAEASTSTHKTMEALCFYTYFAATPVNAFTKALSMFAQNNYAGINDFANFTFLYPKAYSSPNANSISVVDTIDQKNYQNDPVSQDILNILGTADSSFCPPEGTPGSQSDRCLSQTDILQNILKDISSDGILPGPNDVFIYNYAQVPLSQLNANTLIAPLLYDDSGNENSNKNKGLPKNNQAQQAANFIRYVTSQNLLNAPITRDDYNTLWLAAYSDNATGEIKKKTDSKGIAAQQALAQYLIALRMYAASHSVASGNLYSILAKRIPQKKDNDVQNFTSRALSEFQMASWRLNNPLFDDKNQWIDKINTASPATIQKEMVVLLSEINYQLYLSRQQQERLLLTNTMILLQALGQTKPNAPNVEEITNTGSETGSEMPH